MDLTVDPCEDFFKYTCGNWIAKNPIPPAANTMTIIKGMEDQLHERIRDVLRANPSPGDSVPVRDAKTLYAACVNTATLESLGLEPLTSIMKNYGGGWPMTLYGWNGWDFDWQETAAAWMRNLDQANLGLSGRDLYLEPSFQAILFAYKDLMKETAKLVRDHLGSYVSDEDIEQQAEGVIAFESELAQIMMPDEDRLNHTKLYNKLSLADLQNATDAIAPKVIMMPDEDRLNHTKLYNKLSLADLQNATDAIAPKVSFDGYSLQITWTTFLNALFSSVGQTWDSRDEVVCYATDFMARLADLLVQTPKKTIANYLHWRLVYAAGDETNLAMRDLFFRFSQNVSGIDEPPERHYECTDLVNNLMGMAVGSVYVSKFFPPSAKQEVEQLVKDLKAAFDGILDSIDWIDAATLEKAKEKNDAIRAFIGYPDFILDPEALADYYFGFTVDEGSHLRNIFSLLSWKWRRQAFGVNSSVNRDAWIIHPTVVDAFYYPSMNSITFPAGILQSPFYEQGRPAAMNFGGIGMVIGHEITHGFDPSGRQYDAHGNLVDWWTDATAEAFGQRAQCFVDQYDGYQVPELSDFLEDPHVNGLLTLGENIADNGGLSEAWFAYLNYIDRNGTEPSLPGLDFLTPEQLFFVTFAYNWCGHSTVQALLNAIMYDQHSPPKFRIYGTLSNNAAFAEAFGCNANHFMVNGNDSCVMWGAEEQR
ncbi:unnamed protein product, partial [Darwinula stevensoni]